MNILLVVLVALIASCSCKDSASTSDGGAQVASDGGASD